MMKKNRFSAFNFSEGSGQVAIGEADFEGVLTLKSWYGLKEALSHLVPLTGEAVEFLEQYACVIEEMEGEYNQTRAPATVDELLVKSLINCQFCASRVHVGANKVCLNCGGNNG